VLAFDTGPNRLSVIEVAASELQPVDESKATPVIEKFLSNRKREELAASEVKRLHDAAKLEYVGDYAKYAANAAAAPAASVPTAAAPTAAAPTTAPKPNVSETDKGIAGLH
jgi:hypothetical protein